MWGNNMSGTGYNPVLVRLYPRFGKLFAATNGSIYCFDPYSGKIRMLTFFPSLWPTLVKL